jgi:mono/diheme cytochrome c family protein/predicted small lipoprotein YifL
MKRLFKWTLRLVAVIVLLICGLIGYVYFASSRQINQTYTVSVPSLSIPTDAASLERGKYIVEKVSMCTECHDKDLGGKIMMDDGAMGRLAAANLTSGRGGLGATYSNDDFARVLLHGVKKDGHSVLFMPSNDFRFNEADAAAVIGYLRSVPPVDREQPAASIGPVARALSLFTNFPLVVASKIDHATVAFNAASGVGTDAVSAGKYLVASAGCHGCHGPELKGGGGPPPGAANITPVGIGNWSEQDFFTALREHKRPNGSTIEEAMPRGYGQMADEDLRKIFSYLRTVPPAGEKSKNQMAAAGSAGPAN